MSVGVDVSAGVDVLVNVGVGVNVSVGKGVDVGVGGTGVSEGRGVFDGRMTVSVWVGIPTSGLGATSKFDSSVPLGRLQAPMYRLKVNAIVNKVKLSLRFILSLLISLHKLVLSILTILTPAAFFGRWWRFRCFQGCDDLI